MLPRMQDEIFHPPSFTFPYHRGHFYDLGAGAKDYCSAHFSPTLKAGIIATLFRSPIDTRYGYDYLLFDLNLSISGWCLLVSSCLFSGDSLAPRFYNYNVIIMGEI